jgi:hypothetical protein
MSPDIQMLPKFSGKTIISKLFELMGKITYIQKDEENKEQKYKYLSYEAVSEKIQAALIELKLIALPEFETVSEKEYATAKGALWKYIRMKLVLQIVDVETGEFCIAVGEGSGVDPGDKAVAKAQTMAMKNLWCKLLNVPIGTDPEADPATDQQIFSRVLSYGLPAYEQHIMWYWNQAGWDLQQLPGWIQARFSRTPDQLTQEECYQIMNEFASYAQHKQGGQTQ